MRPHRETRHPLIQLSGKHCDKGVCTTCGGTFFYLVELTEYLSGSGGPAPVLSGLTYEDVCRLTKGFVLRRVVAVLGQAEPPEQDQILLAWSKGPAKHPPFSAELLERFTERVRGLDDIAAVVFETLLPQALERNEDGKALRRLIMNSLPERADRVSALETLNRLDMEEWEREAPNRRLLEAERKRLHEERIAAKHEAVRRSTEEVSLRKELISSLEGMSPEDRLRKLVSADEATLAAWPAELTDFTSDLLIAAGSALRIELLKRLRKKKKGHLHRLRGRIHIIQKHIGQQDNSA